MPVKAIISDIHANIEALEVVLKDIESKGITDIYCLGVIGYEMVFGDTPSRSPASRAVRRAGSRTTCTGPSIGTGIANVQETARRSVDRRSRPRHEARRQRHYDQRMDAVTVFGVLAVSFMMLMYALEARHAGYVLAFAVGCLLSSIYGFWSGAWPFGVVEIIWAGVALRRYSTLRTLR